MKIGPLPDACRTPAGRLPDVMPDVMKPDIHCVRTRWIRGFMAFQMARRTPVVMLVVLM